MTTLIWVELEKARTLRSSWAILVSAQILVLFGVVLTLATSVQRNQHDIRSLISFAGSAGLVVILLAIVSAAGEYRHRTIVAELLITPDRRRLVLAKALTFALIGAATGLASLALTLALSVGWLAAKNAPGVSGGVLVQVTLGTLAYCALCGVLGVGLGALVTNQVAAVAAMSVALFVIDPTVSTLLPGVGRFGPGAIGVALSGAGDSTGGPYSSVLPVWQAAAILLAYAVALLGAGTAAGHRREIR
jgi:ABC-2 type transport system permease protein